MTIVAITAGLAAAASVIAVVLFGRHESQARARAQNAALDRMKEFYAPPPVSAQNSAQNFSAEKSFTPKEPPTMSAPPARIGKTTGGMTKTPFTRAKHAPKTPDGVPAGAGKTFKAAVKAGAPKKPPSKPKGLINRV